MNTGFEVYQKYIALKNHFYSEYDYFKYSGKSSATLESYERRKDKSFFQRLGKKDGWKNILLASFVERDAWIGELDTEECNQNYKKWKKRMQSLTYYFDNDIRYLKDNGIDSFQELFRSWRHNKICLETFILLDVILDIVNKYEDCLKDDLIIWQSLAKKKVEKYKPFLQKYLTIEKFRKRLEKHGYNVIC